MATVADVVKGFANERGDDSIEQRRCLCPDLKNISKVLPKKSPDKKFHLHFQGKDLAFDFAKIHDELFPNLSGGKHFASVDMRAANGTSYDVDFFIALRPGQMIGHGHFDSQD
jgi:hypothetical protein